MRIVTSKEMEIHTEARSALIIAAAEAAAAFGKEFESLRQLRPDHHGWNSALYSYKVCEVEDGYRIAMPARYLPFTVDGYEYFEDYLLSKTLFNSHIGASDTAFKIVFAFMGY